MKAAAKLRGGKPSELTRFKALWRDDLSEPARESLRSLFVSSATQAQIRSEVREKYGIKLDYDRQLNQFREWELAQRELDLQAEKAAEIEHRLRNEHPDWTVDQVRDDLLKRMMQESWATGDYKLGLQTVDRHVKVKVTEIDREKLELLKRKAAQAEQTETVLNKADWTPEQREQALKEIYGR